MTVRRDPGAADRAGPAVDLAPYASAGLFDAYELHLVSSLARLEPGMEFDVALALALAARAPRFGHVCTSLAPVGMLEEGPGSGEGPEIAVSWPDPAAWERAVRASPLVADAQMGSASPRRPLVWDLGRLYLQRLWLDELQVAEELDRRAATGEEADPSPSPRASDKERAGPQVVAGSSTEGAIARALDALFGPEPSGGSDAGGADPQRRAVERALRHRISIVAGGPGTGKTHTVARILAAAHLVAAAGGEGIAVALTAPTGKAAHRMSEAVAEAVGALVEGGAIGPELAEAVLETPAVTLHRLLGARGDATFYHHRHRPLPVDLVIVDETSMVSLSLLARLVTALRPEARLVLVGDPSQLTSIEAGTVMSDLVGPNGHARVASGPGDITAPAPLSGRVTVLERVHRFAADSGIAALAAAVRSGDVDGALQILVDGGEDVRWIRPDDEPARAALEDDVVADGVAMVDAARSGDERGALEWGSTTKVLCAVRRGPDGRRDWSDRISSAVLARAGVRTRRRWYAGRPIMITANDPVNRLLNGDVGVVVEREERLQVAFVDGPGVRRLAPAQLDQFDEWWAMTIHKSQGSEFAHAVVVLPRAASPILSRELLYTGVTRARQRLTVVSTEESLRTAIGRAVARASGLAERLWGADRTVG